MKKRFNLKHLWIIITAVIITAILLDYLCVKFMGTMPFFSISKEDTEKQIITHNAIFYKVWECTGEEENFTIGSYKDKAPECPKLMNFQNGYYTNLNGIRISSKQYETLKYYYDYYAVNSWKTEEELNEAIYITDELESKVFCLEKSESGISLAIFKEKIDGVWECSYKDSYCVKANDDKTEYLFTKYSNDKCGTDWSSKKQEYSKDLCDTLRKDTKINISNDIGLFCD